MNILLSPIIWIVLGAFYIFNRKPKGTNLSIFDRNENGTATTTSGSIITGVTITSAKAKSLSVAIWDELNNVFTSESAILNLLKGLNEKDFMLVFDQFGLKDRSLLGAEGGYFGSQSDLITWINTEIDDASNKARLNKQFPNIF